MFIDLHLPLKIRIIHQLWYFPGFHGFCHQFIGMTGIDPNPVLIYPDHFPGVFKFTLRLVMKRNHYWASWNITGLHTARIRAMCGDNLTIFQTDIG